MAKKREYNMTGDFRHGRFMKPRFAPVIGPPRKKRKKKN